MSTWPTVNKTHPSVSILTPTYNRRRFLPWLIECIRAQTYPRDRMEWVVYDDGTDKIEDLLIPHMKELNIQYFSSDSKLNIGAKRNFLHTKARGEICVTMDDDDYYMPERVAHAVLTLQRNKTTIVGSTRNFLYFTDDGSIWSVGPYGPRHGTFGTMAYTREYARAHPCNEDVTHAEEVNFTESYKAPLAQLDPFKVMLVMCHSENTFSKHKLRDAADPLIKKTDYKLKAFIRDAKLREFYAHA
jgi:glycosyltransferase involved in cell wall biosynthesis